jgi:hypothetical protein
LVALGPRAVGLLCVLWNGAASGIKRYGDGDRMDGLAVEESNSPVQIAALRRVLSEAPGGDRWIETLPRRGYRFVGPVEVQDEAVHLSR